MKRSNFTEIRKAGKRKGDLQSDEFLVIYSCDSAVRKNGVEFILNKKVRNSVVKMKCFSDRVLMVGLRGEEKDLVIIQVCMPTGQHPEEEIDEQYEMIEALIEKKKKGRLKRRNRLRPIQNIAGK